MKKITALLSFFILLTAFTCENEPLDEEISTDPVNNLTCAEVTANTAIAALNFAGASDTTYTQLCVAYKAALTAQIAACGDTDGSLQATVNVLGDCSIDNQVDDCELAELATISAEEALDNATTDNYTQLCNALVTALQAEIIACGDADGSLQADIDALGDCTQSNGTADHHALMTANLDGEQFNALVPFFYPFTNQAVGVVTFAADNDVERYLRVQGNSTPNALTDQTKEINLYIPESIWMPGTYTLNDYPLDANQNPSAHFNIIVNDGTGFTQAGEIAGGTITITEFNLGTRTIMGTFEFSYNRNNPTTGEESGPFQCTNGTFDYSLDADYFD